MTVGCGDVCLDDAVELLQNMQRCHIIVLTLVCWGKANEIVECVPIVVGFPSDECCGQHEDALGPCLPMDVVTDQDADGSGIVRLLAEIQRHQTIYISYLNIEFGDDFRNTDFEVLHNIELCRLIKVMRVHVASAQSIIPLSMMQHLAQQLRGCNQLETLNLKNVPISVELVAALQTMTALQELSLRGSMSEEVNQAIISGLSHCTSLGRLCLRQAGLSAADLQVLADAVKGERLPELKQLDLSENTLTDCLKYLLGDAEVRFTCLKCLSLTDTDLSADDLHDLSDAVKGGRLPQLRILDLSPNNLTGRC